MADPVTVIIEEDGENTRIDPATGTIEVDQPDGGVVVQLDAHRPGKESKGDFYDNLADDIESVELSRIANELSDAIKADDDSRQGYLQIRARGLGLLGLDLKPPRSVSDSGTESSGMPSVTNPLLLEAVLRGWANAQGEFLPADGPVKIRDDGGETVQEDNLAEAFERDFNHYLTTTAREYYPDTSYMLLWGVYFGGSGFKKIYRCPMRRRPVSESVKVEDLIVSDTMKDLSSCARITHQIEMRPSIMKRMIKNGAYRKTTDLAQPPTPQPNAVQSKVAGIQGTQPQRERPEDQPYIIWETQCELDLDQYAPKQFKDEGIPLPYLVTLDKDTREILAIRRDWREDDEECERKRMYVRWPYVPGPGFYGTGMVNILGNSSAAMTMAWQEALDAGAFASFPGGLIMKGAAKQNTSNFRANPGEFLTVQTNGMRIQDAIMPMPYRDATAGLMAMIDKITQQSKELSGVADIPTSEGIQNVPVGTMLAQIEQATKVIAAAHKGQHSAQSEEFELITELFMDNPEDFWRMNKVCPRGFWNAEKFAMAVQNCNLTPVSDPNVPSHLHRVMKAMALLTLQTNPVIGVYMSAKETLTRILNVIKEDPTNLIIEPPPQGPQMEPDKMIAANAKMQDSQTKMQMAGIKQQEVAQKGNLQSAEIAGKERLAQAHIEAEYLIHAHDAEKERNRAEANRVKEYAAHMAAMRAADRDDRVAAHQAGLDMHRTGLEYRDRTLAEGGAVLDAAKHAEDCARSDREHELASAQYDEDCAQNERDYEIAKLEAEAKMKAASRPQPKPKK